MQFVFQSQSRRCGSTSLFQLPVDIFDFAFEANLQVFGPSIELAGFLFEKSAIPLRYSLPFIGLLLVDYRPGKSSSAGLASCGSLEKHHRQGHRLIVRLTGVCFTP
jgi:hypothetical protein